MVYSLWMLYLFACMILQAAKIEELIFSLEILGRRHESLKQLTQRGAMWQKCLSPLSLLTNVCICRIDQHKNTDYFAV